MSAPSEDLRAALRRDALARRRALPAGLHAAHTAVLVRHLAPLLVQLAPHTLALYWPIRGEIDLRPCVADWLAADPRRRAALPVVERRAAPLAFRLWTPDAPMAAGEYGIPIPAHSAPCTPDVLLVPLAAFDATGNRIGYGGGYYDRTLAALPDARAIGVAFELARVPSTLPQPHDRSLHWVVTEAGAFAGAVGG